MTRLTKFVCLWLLILPVLLSGQGPSLSATFRGLGEDVISPYALAPDGLPDYLISLAGLRGTPSQVSITSENRGIWRTPFDGTNWIIRVDNPTATTATLRFSQWPSNQFRLVIRYPDGSSDQVDSVYGAVPTTLTATFRGRASDVTSPYALTPDGIADFRITLGGLKGTPSQVTITSDSQGIWRTPFDGENWLVQISPLTGSSANIHFSEWPSNSFRVHVRYPDGSFDQTDSISAIPPSTLAATFRGLGTDIISPYAPASDGLPDYRIALKGLRGPISNIAVSSESLGVWRTPFDGANWIITTTNTASGEADIQFSEWPSNQFLVRVWYTDGSYDETQSVDGRPASTLSAKFRGVGSDVLSPYALAPDGSADYVLALGGLRGAPSRVTLNSESGGIWRMPFDGSNWMIRLSNQSGANAELNFSQWTSRNFLVRVWYPDGSYDQALSSYEPGADEADVVRFLKQATFGPTPGLIDQAKQSGIADYIERQLTAPMNTYPDLAFWPLTRPATCIDPCARDNYTHYMLQRHFFWNAVNGEDQLRQRVAFALSQILVTSAVDVPYPAWMRRYQQLLYSNAFGNYRQLLYDVTLDPTMGRFLDMQGSRCQRANPVNVNVCRNGLPSQPNENYAREVLQLFSVGTFLLEPDGNRQRDANGNPIPTYDQKTVEEFARVFTGWGLAPNIPGPPELGETTVPNYRDPMVQHLDTQNREDYHDQGSKTLLNGIVLPAGQTAGKDLNDAIDNIAYHPSVAPFISRQLIQHLVTSNPSPAYVRRVADVFTLFSRSQSQLFQVVRAILLDPEARSGHQDPATAADYGKLREPALFITNVIRAFGGTTDGVLNTLTVNGSAIGAAEMSQDLFNAPSVFNYYPPAARVPGEIAGGPEFAIYSSLTSLRRDNFVYRLIYATIPPALPTRPSGTVIDLAPWDSLASNPDELLNRLNMLLLNGSMSASMRTSIRNAVLSIPGTDARGRVRAAIYLVLTSSQYQVER